MPDIIIYIPYIVLFLAKFLDSFLQGTKSIAVHRRQVVKSSILASILMFLFLFIISEVVATHDVSGQNAVGQVFSGRAMAYVGDCDT